MGMVCIVNIVRKSLFLRASLSAVSSSSTLQAELKSRAGIRSLQSDCSCGSTGLPTAPRCVPCRERPWTALSDLELQWELLEPGAPARGLRFWSRRAGACAVIARCFGASSPAWILGRAASPVLFSKLALGYLCDANDHAEAESSATVSSASPQG